MPQFSHNGVTIFYIERGQGVPFIFLHGLGGSTQQIEQTFIPPANIRLITLDFRGHGNTQLGNLEQLSIETLSYDVKALTRHLQLNKFIIGGISMGAAVSLNYALSFPEDLLGLILSRPSWVDGPMCEENRIIFKYVADLILKYGAEKGCEWFVDSDVYHHLSIQSPSAAKSMLNHFHYAHAKETAAKYELLTSSQPSRDRKDWTQIKTPALILANRLDPIHPYEYGLLFAQYIKTSVFCELTPKSTSEELHLKDVQKHIETFIQSITKK